MARPMASAAATTPGDVTAAVVRSFVATPDERLRFLLERMVRHLHEFIEETQLTQDEWAAAIEFLTATGKACTPIRQEFVLLSDTLGVSMLVDLLANRGTETATESTVLGPFYVSGSFTREMGESIAERDGYGDPAFVSGTVKSTAGRPIDGAALDVWQNASNGKYAVQDDQQPEQNLRGKFHTGPDGRFWFWAVRPTDYRIADDGPVGRMLAATGRHPWRPAHIHLKVSALGYRPVTTHLFDDESPYLTTDAVFAVKPSLVCHFERHEPDEPGAPVGCSRTWFSLEHDLVLAEEA